MSILRWDPFEELREMQRSIDRLFDELTGRRPARRREAREPVVWEPAVEVYETDHEVVVRAELPGVDPKSVNVTVQDNTLTVEAEAREEQEERGRNYLRRELRYGQFSRTVALPAEVKPDAAKATFRNGLLEVRVPKSERAKPKQVKVEVS
ncbi:MAG: molecular chaperone [Thermus sp.]